MRNKLGSVVRHPSTLHPPPSTLLLRSVVSGLSSVVFLLAGCSTPPPENWVPEQHSKPEAKVTLSPGDQLEITFLGAPELNTTQNIRRDGRITLRLLGEIPAAGKTPGELQAELLELYRPQLQIKEVAVYLRSPSPVFVTGAVLKPGRVDTTRPMTLMEAISEVGGVDAKLAEVRSVIVIRHEGGRRYGYRVNLKPALQGEPGPAFYVRPFDIVYVPRTFIAKVDQWVDQHINQLIPDLGVTVSSEGEIFFSP